MASVKKRRRLRTVRWAQLELLAAMDHAQTLTAAATAAGVAQPAASRLLRELEERTGIEFFEKFGRTLRPTRSGQLVLQRASRLVADLNRLEEELEALDKGLMGTVTLGAGVAPCFVLVPRALGALAQGSSKISVKLREGGMDELTEKLRAGKIDLLVGRFEFSSHYNDIEMEALYDPPMKIVCGCNHPLSRKRNVSLDEAIRGNWILPEEGTSMRRGIESLFRAKNIWPIECLVESSSIQANIALLNASEVIWVLSADIAAYFEKTNQLKILPVSPLKGPGPILLANLKTRTTSHPVKRLQECLRNAAKNLTQAMQPVRGKQHRFIDKK